MSRRKAAPKRIILPDPLFGSKLVAKFINTVMQNGKRAGAEKIVYGALERVADRMVKTEGESASSKDVKKKTSIRSDAKLRQLILEKFTEVLNKVRPSVEVRSRRVGGATYQIPVEVKSERGIALAMRWLINYARLRGEKNMILRLAGEIFDALEGRGNALKKKEDVHKMAKANQAFAHYRW
jgi:small subunit ribosomal protein S7